MLDKISNIKKYLGDNATGAAKKTKPLVQKINALEGEMQALSDEALRAKTAEFKSRLQSGETLESLLPEAFALVREASVRETGLRHFDVQLTGGILLFQGKITEMKTGEGKTLVATLPVYLRALEGRGVHVVTVNDYLARRDAVWVGQIYARLGLSVGVINGENQSYVYDSSARVEHDEERDQVGAYRVIHEFLRASTRKESYECDITYGTNSEFGFDYLRDNLEFDASHLRQRELAYAVVDEIDSILIDDARTPLIISSSVEETENLYAQFAQITSRMKEGEHYIVDEKMRQVALTDAGIEVAEQALGIENLYTDRGITYVHHLETAVRAKALYHSEREYVIQNNQVVIVDESTGRLQPGRRWSEGIHQAIEAKEGLPIQSEMKTVASVTYQNYFRMYETLCGMTGTAETSAEEFYKVYNLDVALVPTHRPVARIDKNDLIFQTERGKFMAIAKKVKELNQKGQPVLIGTITVEKSESLSQFLDREGIRHTVLNAKKHEQEGGVIANAGKKGAVTVATNMAGRGVDIKLGGAEATEDEYKEVVALGGLYVIGTERHDARRIDNQLRGRSGRQGDPGETQFYVSLEDDMMRIFAGDMVKNMMGRMGLAEDEPIEHRMISRSLENAQTRIEGMHFDSRKHILQFDDVLNTQRITVYGKRRTVLVGSDEEVEALIQEIATTQAQIKEVQEAKESVMGKAQFLTLFRKVYLEAINTYWMEHLDTMDMLRSSVSLRAYGQKDPLIEYKREGLMFFKQMLADIDTQTITTLEGLEAESLEQLEERAQARKQEMDRITQQSLKTQAEAKARAQPAIHKSSASQGGNRAARRRAKRNR
ncbi:MAG: preprotein translocase subunit SecA [Patescibacteria group bacterium]